MSSQGSEKHGEAKFCFVISPIGAEGSETRQHADIVYNCIIQPGCEAADQGEVLFRCERGDHKAAPGKITDQIYEDILAADLIIAVLTESNPNVYYELAVAQAAAKRVILLLQKGFAAPFDIKDHRIIYYDFDPPNIFHRTYAKQLRAAINSLESRRPRPIVPFAPHLTPLGDPMQLIGARATEAEPDAIRIVSEAKKSIRLMGYSMHGWTMNDDFKRAMNRSALNLKDGIYALLAHPSNETLKGSMKNNEAYLAAKEMIQNSAGLWRSLLSSLVDNKFSRFHIRLNEKNTMGYQILMSEREAILVPYLVSRDTARSPYIYIKSESPYFEVISDEFMHIWSTSSDFASAPALAAVGGNELSTPSQSQAPVEPTVAKIISGSS